MLMKIQRRILRDTRDSECFIYASETKKWKLIILICIGFSLSDIVLVIPTPTRLLILYKEIILKLPLRSPRGLSGWQKSVGILYLCWHFSLCPRCHLHIMTDLSKR